MALKPLESKSLSVYFSTGAFAATYYYLLCFNGGSNPPQSCALVYLDRLDLMLATLQYSSPSPICGVGRFDPLGVDNTAPLAGWVSAVGSQTPDRLAVGEWDRVANTQAIYGGISASNPEFWLVDPITYKMFDDGASHWPFYWDGYPGGIAGIGTWDQTAGAQGLFHFFETWGYALKACARVKHTDGNNYRGLALIDLSTGLATLLDVPTFYTGTPAALFEAPPFDGNSFGLCHIQYVPDDDDLPAAPKGRVFLSSFEYFGDGPKLGATDPRYLKVIEWNPLDVDPAPGTPNREHLREILMTKLIYIQKDEFETEGGVINSLGGYPDPGGTSVDSGLITRYHPPSRTFICYSDWTPYSEAASVRGMARHSQIPALDRIEPPTAQSEVETNKTVIFKSRGLGELGEPLAGVDVNWTLERRSTIDEVLDTSGAPVSNIVAHPPMDEGSCVVEYLGTPLTEGVDYSVVEATGTITWLGAHSPPNPSGYTASYRHSTVSASPPHGTLLQAISETDVEGFAETQVQYPDDDDLEEARDYLTVEMSDE